jgi:hypothetical protein
MVAAVPQCSDDPAARSTVFGWNHPRAQPIVASRNGREWLFANTYRCGRAIGGAQSTVSAAKLGRRPHVKGWTITPADVWLAQHGTLPPEHGATSRLNAAPADLRDRLAA